MSVRLFIGSLRMIQLLPQFCRFVMVGSCATAIHYSILTFLVELFQVRAVLATTVGFVVAATANYVLNRRFTFEFTGKHVVAAPKFLTVALLGAVMNAVLFGWLEAHTSFHYLVLQICATITVLAWDFTANAIWTFKKVQ